MRNPEYQFVNVDPDRIVSELISVFEKLTGKVIRPASPERLYVQFTASVIVQLLSMINYAGNQNIPSRADDFNLDQLGQLFMADSRPEAVPAVSTQRFTIDPAQPTSVLVPRGTRVTDNAGEIVWETTEDKYIPIGGMHADVPIQARTPGTIGNGFALGQIDKMIDIGNVQFFASTENVTVSEKGADRADDDTYYELMRLSMDSLSTAGPRGAYIYHAKSVSTEIADVMANSPAPGTVKLYVLMNDGTPAGEEIKNAVAAACNEESVRPLTDYVTVDDPDIISYNIDFTYYIPSGSDMSMADVAEAVNEAVQDYIKWQHGKFGRDINPDELRKRVKDKGVKRIVLIEPAFTMLHSGKENPPEIPQMASVNTVNVINGGFEDE